MTRTLNPNFGQLEVVAPAKVSHSLCVEDSVMQAAMSEQARLLGEDPGAC